MKVTNRYFARLSEEIGRATDTLSIDSLALTAEKLWVQATGRPLSSERILIAINQEYDDKNAELHDGDEIAFFPPVSGG